MMWIMRTINKLICKCKGHKDIILEVHRTKDLIRCAQCNKIRGYYGRL